MGRVGPRQLHLNGLNDVGSCEMCRKRGPYPGNVTYFGGVTKPRRLSVEDASGDVGGVLKGENRGFGDRFEAQETGP